MTRPTFIRFASLMLALGAAACQSDATGASEGTAAVSVAARGDDAPPAASSAPAEEGAPSFSQTSAEGTVHFRARVFVRSTTGGWVELTDRAAQQVTVDASGRGEAAQFATARVAAGSYSRVRVVFEEVSADLSGELRLSTGVLSGRVTVDLAGDGEVVVEREIRASASADAVTRLLINLNADAWLGSTSAQTRTVGEAAFASAVRVSAE